VLESAEVLLSLNPQNARAWELKGNALQNLNKSEESLLSYNKAIKFGIDYDKLRLEMALVFSDTRNYQEAIKNLEKATKGNSDNSWFIANVAYINLFLVRLKRNDDKDSLKKAWRDLVEQNKIAEKHIEKEKVNSLLIDVIWKAILISIELGNLDNLSEVLNETDFNDRLFYFYRAFEYLKTNDDLLIESLSPEAKDVVEKILQKIENLKKK
jgi:tetratricopeptide (TPR) repeat protein